MPTANGLNAEFAEDADDRSEDAEDGAESEERGERVSASGTHSAFMSSSPI
jgi:hypothetical protein